MKKKNYEKPQVEIIEAKAAGLICTSGSSTEGLTQDDFDWGAGPLGSPTEPLTEDNYIW